MAKRDKLEQFELEMQEDELYMNIGQCIRQRLDSRQNSKHRKITQEELAADVARITGTSCSRSTVARWISGSRHPSILQLLAVCRVLDCSVEYLCGNKGKDRDNEAAERFTGLSAEAVEKLHGIKNSVDVSPLSVIICNNLPSDIPNQKKSDTLSDILHLIEKARESAHTSEGPLYRAIYRQINNGKDDSVFEEMLNDNESMYRLSIHDAASLIERQLLNAFPLYRGNHQRQQA